MCNFLDSFFSVVITGGSDYLYGHAFVISLVIALLHQLLFQSGDKREIA